MARRFISTAKFNPYTYEQLSAPIQRATAILAQQAQGLNALEMQNAALEKYLDPELDANEYNLYKQNEARLRAASDELLRTGLNANTYNTLRDASMIYARDIKPMQAAAANRAQYNANITELLVKNPDAVLKSNYKHTLSEFYNGIPQTEFVSGNAIQKDVSDIMTQLANARADVLNGRNIDKYNKIIYFLTGYTAEEYKQIMQNPQSEVYAILHSVLQKHGVEDANGANLLNNQADYDKMRQYALAGTRSLIGKTEAKVTDNGYYKDVQIAHSNRDYNFRVAQETVKQQKELLELAGTIAANTGQSLDEVMASLTGQKPAESTDNSEKKKGVSFKYVQKGVTDNKYPQHAMGNLIFDNQQIARSARDAVNIKPKDLGNGRKDWSNLDDFRFMNTQSGSKSIFKFRDYVNNIALRMGIDLSNMSQNQYEALRAELIDLGRKADIAIPKYTYRFRKTENAKVALNAIDDFYIDEKPTEDQKKNASSVTFDLDMNNPDILVVKIGDNSFKANLSGYLQVYRSYDALRQQMFDTYVALTKQTNNDNTGLQEMSQSKFWSLPYDAYSEYIGSLHDMGGSTLDALIMDIADKLQTEQDAFNRVSK